MINTGNDNSARYPGRQGLYAPEMEHDSCGVGFVVNMDGSKSHRIIENGVEILLNLLHRGALGADKNTGDGAGLLFQIPDKFFRKVSDDFGSELPAVGAYGVGMLFLPRNKKHEAASRAAIEKVVAAERMELIGWRDVPVDSAVLGETARRQEPKIAQLFVKCGDLTQAALERKLYVLRKQIDKAIGRALGAAAGSFYGCSLSCRTIVYKGLMMPTQVTGFYRDLADNDLESAVAIIHQRYSTNTFPSWPLAQPFRYLAHNGEINTLRGNLNWMRSRENNLESPLFGDDIKKIVPIIEEGVSDSACLDNALELLVNGGRSLHHSMAMLVPQAWGEKYPMGPDLRGFFEYHAGLMEPWDGPAALAFCDGRFVGAMLDRNGLRPARYTVTKSGFMVFASESGVLDIDPSEVKEKGALRPGQMILVDMQSSHLLKDYEIKMRLARKQPYRRWVDENKISIHGFRNEVASLQPDTATLEWRERLFGYTREDLNVLLRPMAATGHEPVGSMGADEPLAVFSEKPQLLYWYFKQIFAQVTNPPIDPIREELVMSLMTFLGTTDQILDEKPQHARLVKLKHPILVNENLERIRNLNIPNMACSTIAIGFAAAGGGTALRQALVDICDKAERLCGTGSRFVVLSDKELEPGQIPIPALLAVAAVNRRLMDKCLRTSAALLVETGEAREVMHMALLLGYGASAVNPYLAFEIVAGMVQRGELGQDISITQGLENYVTALCEGLRKIMSKVGISTLRSYRNAQVFQAIGLGSDFVNEFFPGTATPVSGIGLEEVAREAMTRYEQALQSSQPGGRKVLPSGGHYEFNVHGERHLWNPESISNLQRATRENDPERYRLYADSINEQTRRQSTLRGMFTFKPRQAIPIEEVEPASEIMKRFVTGAMSFGSISREAHETLAIAMNRIGGMSNSGEGGEDPARYVPLENGDSRSSAIKQVASGRFGVTAEYLVNARDLQIKIAQGAKPGEGGQLPGHKVNAEIARVRHSTPGVTLISPPPHHDIYSIEDIAQLIYDLKNANPEARVSVKLVSEVGVGTIAAGVSKAHADMILISGYDGGTGASPVSSIRHAGAPWEVGLAEAQQTLVMNGLRSRVRLQTDGQLKTGRDVVMAALLGAEEFGVATAALVVCGCLMMRVCHKNTCPVGVATQDPELRKRFTGKPEYVVNFFNMMAQEIRTNMAQLGFRKMDEMIGRSDLLEVNTAIDFWKTRGLDFTNVFFRHEVDAVESRCTIRQEHGLEKSLDMELLPHVENAIETGKPVTLTRDIRNVNRTVGTILSSRIARRHGGKGLPADTLTLRFRGSAGQSFGAFCGPGMTLVLEGEANDYLGKGLSGARIVVKAPADAGYKAEDNIIAGNVLFYGATSGEAYLNGRVGERFAIRNSGARLVVEGVGDHACEYMTGGRVVILGTTGVNFGAGMSGGIAYVFDEAGEFDNNCNLKMIDLDLVDTAADEKELRGLIETHLEYTGSAKAAYILENWELCLTQFVKVFPMEYKKALGSMSSDDASTEREVPQSA